MDSLDWPCRLVLAEGDPPILESREWKMRDGKLSTIADQFSDVFGNDGMHRNLPGWTREVLGFGETVDLDERGGEVGRRGEGGQASCCETFACQSGILLVASLV